MGILKESVATLSLITMLNCCSGSSEDTPKVYQEPGIRYRGERVIYQGELTSLKPVEGDRWDLYATIDDSATFIVDRDCIGEEIHAGDYVYLTNGCFDDPGTMLLRHLE